MPNFDNPARRTTAQRLDRATPFSVSEEKEALLRMRDEQPGAFAKLPPSVHIAAGLYESDKANHAHLTAGNAA